MKEQFSLPVLFLATNNQGKIRELKDLLSGFVDTFYHPGEFPGIQPVPEKGKSYYENALIKANYYAGKTGYPTLADDSGLEIDFLDGGPGVQSARFLGLNTTFEEKMKHILFLLNGVPGEKRRARFVCEAVLVWPDGKLVRGHGELHGVIAEKIIGEGGFGYDPIFMLPERGITVATLTADEKNRISHRALAIKDIIRQCESAYA
ncbi:MAG: RdgB/HAM1 family non-canonical purine NTP pyrophosphatase [Candidatus Eremiobacteraeota bacterium]|nr:RdgB/HAM1 family non-canonical purine NTP pyrophosphatase [Candidatus Eremiobacteraeota bacterium]